MLKTNSAMKSTGALLEEQKELLAPKLLEIISNATHYSFESDESVCLKGPNGSLWVFEDGTVTPVSEESGTNGYPAYLNPEYLAKAKEIALKYLSL